MMPLIAGFEPALARIARDLDAQSMSGGRIADEYRSSYR
jgi:hypothetical protein